MTHRNAPLSETGRLRLACCIVEDGWPLRRAAERFNVSVTTAQRWAQRYRAHGPARMRDHSSRPHHQPRRVCRRRQRRVVGLPITHQWGPARIAYHLRHQHLSVSTVGKILHRYGCPPLTWIDKATGARLRAQPTPVRYEHDTPGWLVHVDLKKLGRIPDGGGHRMVGRAQGVRNRGRSASGGGYHYIHNAVDDHSRLAYVEVLSDERKDTAAGFWTRAQAWFASQAITVKPVLTDHGSCYRSKAFNKALKDTHITHTYTRPYTPKTNGKVERFTRTLVAEWAYPRPYPSKTDRLAELPGWLHHYNHHRGHTALKSKSPADRVPNLSGDYN